MILLVKLLGIYFKNLFICIDEFILQVPDNMKKLGRFMTCSMVFQSPHGRLNYSFMLLDRDVAYFNFIFINY